MNFLIVEILAFAWNVCVYGRVNVKGENESDTGGAEGVGRWEEEADHTQ